ncbi:MAG: tyrosine-protein phosphatase [Planctomycetaceae bacterium]
MSATIDKSAARTKGTTAQDSCSVGANSRGGCTAGRCWWSRGVAIVVLAAGVALAISPDLARSVRDRFIPKRFGVVEPGKLFRSGQISTALVKKTLKQHGIKRVVDLTGAGDTPEKAYHDAELVAIDELGIARVSCPLNSDGTGDVVVYAAAVKALVDAQRAGEPALVHCAAGTQRTGGVVALYRLFVQHKPPEEVFAEMQRYKYDAKRSPKLLAYLNEHMPELAQELVCNGAIDRVPETLPALRAAE